MRPWRKNSRNEAFGRFKAYNTFRLLLNVPFYDLFKFQLLRLVLFTCLVLGHIYACKSDSSYSAFDNEDLSPIVNQFLQEATSRGVDIEADISDLKVRFGKLPKGKAGSCKIKKKLVTIDPTVWSAMDSMQRQALVFHELAHCSMNRKHENSTLPRGECKSLMIDNFSDSTCYYDFYSAEWRNYYLDELFNLTDAIPKWYNEYSLNEFSNGEVILDTLVKGFSYFDINDILPSQNYLIQLDSISDVNALAGINCAFETFDITLNKTAFQVTSKFEPISDIRKSRVTPTIYYRERVSSDITQMILMKQDKFYDIFINGKHVYRNSTDFPVEYLNQMFYILLFSDDKKTRLEFSLKVIELSD